MKSRRKHVLIGLIIWPFVEWITFVSILCSMKKSCWCGRRRVNSWTIACCRPFATAIAMRASPAIWCRKWAGWDFSAPTWKVTAAPGMSNVEYGLIMQELERGDSGVRSFVSVQGALVMYPIYTYGSEEQKQQWLPRLQSGASGGLLRTDRAGLRLEPGGHAHHRAARRRRLDSERRENLDHQRHAGGCGDRVGARRGRHPRIPGGEGHAGIHVVGHSRQVVDARIGDVQPVAGGLPRSGERHAARREGTEGAAGLPFAGALRDRLGRAGRGHGLLRDGAPVHHPAQAVRRPADRVASTGAGEAGLDDHRDHQGAIAGGAGRPAEGPGQSWSRRTSPC